MLLKDMLHDSMESTRSWFIEMPVPNQMVLMQDLLKSMESMLADQVDTFPYPTKPEDLHTPHYITVFTKEIRDYIVDFIDVHFPTENLTDKVYFMLMSLDMIMDYVMQKYSEEYQRRCQVFDLHRSETEEEFIRRIRNN